MSHKRRAWTQFTPFDAHPILLALLLLQPLSCRLRDAQSYFCPKETLVHKELEIVPRVPDCSKRHPQMLCCKGHQEALLCVSLRKDKIKYHPTKSYLGQIFTYTVPAVHTLPNRSLLMRVCKSYKICSVAKAEKQHIFNIFFL